MARKRLASRLHLLSVRTAQTAGDGDHSDGGGLLLRVRGDSATWVFRYTASTSKRREMGLGSAHRGNAQQAGQSIVEARDLAAEARALLQRGLDPIDERQRRRDEQAFAAQAAKQRRTAQGLTLARAARDYHERVIEPTKTDKHAAQWISSLENHMPAELWHKPIGDVTAPDLLRALLETKPHERARRHDGDTVPETMRRIRQRLDAVFEDAIFHGSCSTNPAAAIKRKMREAMPREKAGEFAALPYREVPALFARLRAMPGTAARCLELALLTAARANEILSAEWCDFDLTSSTWTVPAEKMKAREEHKVYLPDSAIALLKAQRALNLHPTIVFPSPVDPEKGLSNMAMLAVLGRLAMRDRTTVHGLCRASFSTWANETGAARPDVIEACLAHNERDKVRAAYNRAQFNEERRTLLAAWASFLETPPARVVALAA